MEEDFPWESGSEMDSSWEEVSVAAFDWEVGMEMARVTRNYLGGQIIAPWAVFERGFIDHVSDTDEGRLYPYFVFLRDNWDGGPTPVVQNMEGAHSWPDITHPSANRWFRRMPVPAT